MTENQKNKLFLLAAIVFVTLAIIGGIRAYSPVPYWDMWNGYLGFFTKVVSGDVSAWWGQHNEHRIVLARALFWLDIALFAGQGWFLIVVNYLLQALVCMLFWTIWQESEHDRRHWIGYFLIAWLFWWIQKDNLEWGFQGQFILAQLLPLAALYFLHCSTNDGADFNKWFVLAIAFGVLSIGSMANGVLALPIMTGYAVVARMGLRRICTIGIASILMLGVYFYGYTGPAGHGSLGQAIRTNPLGLLHYVLVYVGGAFSFGNNHTGLWAASIAGLFLVGSSSFFALKVLTSSKVETLRLALLAYILYIGGTALGTAGGRLIFGVETALASRYMTPSLMAWSALLILYLRHINTFRMSVQNKLWIVFVVLLVLMLPKQLEALKSKKAQNFESKVAALAVELGVKDEVQIKHVFPSVPWILDLAAKPIVENWSIFGLSSIKDQHEILRTKLNIGNIKDPCQGVIDEVSRIDGDSQYLKLTGWVFDSVNNRVPEYALLVDGVGDVYGVLLTGGDREDVVDVISRTARYSGAKGYLLSDSYDKKLKIFVPESGCLTSAVVQSAREQQQQQQQQ
jgi:hypothetical protein